MIAPSSWIIRKQRGINNTTSCIEVEHISIPADVQSTFNGILILDTTTDTDIIDNIYESFAIGIIVESVFYQLYS